jgi:hypothetical protein
MLQDFLETPPKHLALEAAAATAGVDGASRVFLYRSECFFFFLALPIRLVPPPWN